MLIYSLLNSVLKNRQQQDIPKIYEKNEKNTSVCFQGLIQNLYLVFGTTVEDILRNKGCQRSQSGKKKMWHC